MGKTARWLQKMLKHNLPYNNCTPRSLYKRNENTCPNQDMNVTVYNSIIPQPKSRKQSRYATSKWISKMHYIHLTEQCEARWRNRLYTSSQRRAFATYSKIFQVLAHSTDSEPLQKQL